MGPEKFLQSNLLTPLYFARLEAQIRTKKFYTVFLYQELESYTSIRHTDSWWCIKRYLQGYWETVYKHLKLRERRWSDGPGLVICSFRPEMSQQMRLNFLDFVREVSCGEALRRGFANCLAVVLVCCHLKLVMIAIYSAVERSTPYGPKFPRSAWRWMSSSWSTYGR